MRAVIERNKNSELCSRVEQSAFLRIFAHSMDIRAIGNAVYNRIRTFPQVRRFKNVRLEVVEFMPLHGDIGSVGVVRRGIDYADRAPLGHLWRDIRPMLSVIGCDVDKSIVCTSPEC